jgi:predicted nucleotidyltransferase component of viral defense system
MEVIEQMLAKYPRRTDVEITHAMREVMQEVALAGLYRGGFFDKAAFYGGTCLRIFYGLPRFSEDLDFSLLAPDPAFSFAPYFKTLKSEFAALGFEVEVSEKHKTAATDITSAFLKKTSSVYDLTVQGSRALKIKFEVDTDPPLGFSTEQKLLLQPFSFYTQCFALPDLFAGKVHALLFRQWKQRVKGRDWFDFEWYVKRGTPLNLAHLAIRARQSGHWQGETLSLDELKRLLRERIDTLDVDSARDDVVRFLQNPTDTAIWSRDYFAALADHIAT